MIISGIQLPLSSEDELPQLLLLLPSAKAAIMAVIFTVDKDIAEDYGNKGAIDYFVLDYGILRSVSTSFPIKFERPAFKFMIFCGAICSV